MKVRFLTSIADGSCSYLEGTVRDLPDPLPEPFRTWLRDGIIVPVRSGPEHALAPDAVEQAVARRTTSASGRRRGRSARSADTPDSEADMRGVPVLCPGGTVVCIGSGPSLTPEDVDACRGKATVIAINDNYRLAPWADALYACDAKWWRWHPDAADFQGLKFGLYIERDHRFPAGVHLLQPTGDAGLETDPTGLRTGKNSGYQAINLAVHFGATRIVLLGYDMQRGSDRRWHWFGDHPDGIDPRVDTFLPEFEKLVLPLRQLGVTVINASRETALTCFERQPLAEALRRRRRVAA